MNKIKEIYLNFKNLDKAKQDDLLIKIVIGIIVISLVINFFVLGRNPDSNNKELENNKNYGEITEDIQNLNNELNSNSNNNLNLIENENFKYIHIEGAIKNPGVIKAEIDDRIINIVEKSGGFTENAETKYINLAENILDGEKIYIPTKEEIQKMENEGVGTSNFNLDEDINSNLNLNSNIQNNLNSNLNSSSNSNSQTNKKVNINKATKEELMQISGVGESTANKIIEYRNENGKFYTIEDIKNVSGIGDSKYNSMKDEIEV